MRRATILLAGLWLAAAPAIPGARGQTGFDEVTGVLEVSEDEARIGEVRLVYVPPQRGVDLDPLLAQTADNVRSLAGLEVVATGELRGGILWGARVAPAEEEAQVPVEYFGPAAEFDELTGVLEVTAAAASIEGTRLIYVPQQSRVGVRDLLAQTAANVRALAGQHVRATGQLADGVLWSAVVQRVEEEEQETEVEEPVEPESVEDDGVETVEDLPSEPEPQTR